MTHPYFLEKLAEEHRQRLLLESCRRGLLAIARCCRPAVWRRTWRSLRRQGAG